MSRLPLLAVLALSLFASCKRPPLEEALYQDFLIVFTEPDRWDEELEDIREDRAAEKLDYLAEVVASIEDERLEYAKRCQAFTEPNSAACQSVEELIQVLNALSDLEAGLRTGQKFEGTLGAYLNKGLEGAHLEDRKSLARRVRRHFVPEPVPAGN